MYFRNYFLLDGVCSKDFGVYTNGYGTFGGPTRDVEPFTVPGLHGDIVKDNGRFNNVEIEYRECGVVREGALLRFSDFANFLATHEDGYYRLEDTYHPDVYRMARFVGPLEPEIGDDYTTALFDLMFDCKPQCFLKSGEKWYTKPQTLKNPTRFSASPILRMYGSGTLTVGEYNVTVASNNFGWIDLDCETGDAYSGVSNANSYVTIADEVPKLTPGINGFSSTLTNFEVQPRWWRV